MRRLERLALLERPRGEPPPAMQAAVLNRTHFYYVPVPPSPEELRPERQIAEI